MFKIFNLKNIRFFRDLSWVFIGTISSALFSLLFMKVIALKINPNIYGRYSLNLQVILLVNTVLILPFLNGFLKFFKSQDDKDFILKFYNTLIIIMIIISFPIIIIIFELTYNTSFLNYLFYFLFIVFSVFYGYFKNILYIERHHKYISLSSFFIKFIPFLIILFLTIVVKYVVEDVIWISQILGFVMGSVFLFLYIKKYYPNYYILNLSSIFDSEFIALLKKNISYTIPLIFFGLFSWISNVSDRYLIDYFLTKKDVGIYSANYGLASQIMIMIGGVILGTVKPIMFDYYHNSKKIYMSKIKILYTYFTLGGAVLLLFIYIFSDLITYVFLSNKYISEFNIIFFISLAYFLVNLSYLTEMFFYINGKTKYILYSMVVGAIVNIVFNIVLIPKYAIKGAAWATVLGFLVQFLILFVFFIIFIRKNKL